MLGKVLKSLPYPVLVPIAILMVLAPFHPQPHLVEKIRMMFSGQLTRPIDIFDLVLHATPLILLLAKLVLTGRRRHQSTGNSGT